MADEDRSPGMKSAYEAALEALEARGIAPPREEALSDEDRGRVAEIRRRAEAKLAELEILHRDRMRKAVDPEAREEEERSYRSERRRLEERRDREIERLREAP